MTTALPGTTGLGGRIAIRVHGTPITQGSKTRTQHGGLRDDNAKTLKPWRKNVTTTAADATRYHDTITGPVRVWLRFTFDRPLEHYGTGRNADRIKDRFLNAQPTTTYRPCAGCDSVGASCRAVGCPASGNPTSPEVPRDRAPANYAEQRALLDDSLRNIPPATEEGSA